MKQASVETMFSHYKILTPSVPITAILWRLFPPTNKHPFWQFFFCDIEAKAKCGTWKQNIVFTCNLGD